MEFPFGRQSSRDQIRSSITEGSSRLFGSVMGAKKGLIGGITSTFDQVVNIVGGGDDDTSLQSPTSTSAGSDAQQTETSSGDAVKQAPPKPRPPKLPAPVSRQRSDLNNGAVKQFENEATGTGNGTGNGTRMSRQNTVPTGYGGQPSVTSRDSAADQSSGAGPADKATPAMIDNRPPLKRRNTNPFMEGYDPREVEPDYIASVVVPAEPVKVVPEYNAGQPSKAWDNTTESGSRTTSDLLPGIPRIPSGTSGLAPQQPRDLFAISPTSGAALPQPSIVPGPWDEGRKGRKADDDSDADSEATEGCDEVADEDDLVGEGGADCPSSMMKSGSRGSEQSWSNEAEDEELDDVTRQSMEFMKYFVQRIFDPNSEVGSSDKAEFGKLCQNGPGRLWFSRYVNCQRVHNKHVAEEVFFNLVQFFAILFFECNESEDFGPATTLMNMCFTFYFEVQNSRGQTERLFLYSFLKDQPIWQSPRYWNAAFFYAVQHERAIRPIATSGEQSQTQSDDRSFQENITFGQLGTFTNNMRCLGLSKDQCLEFIKKQATIANLPAGQVKTLRANMERWKEPITHK